MDKKYLSYEEALVKLQAYCAYQERCHQEVRRKLLDLGIYGDEIYQVISDLIEDNFLNEERFACQFAGGKFRVKKWGKNKIIRELKQREISEYCIKKAIKTEIPDEDYYITLQLVIEKRAAMVKDTNLFKRRQKIARYVIDKGFESSLVWEVIKELED